MTQLSVSEIAEMLRSNADAAARTLLPAGQYEAGRSEWKCSARASPTGEAISVHVGRGAKQGLCGFWNGSRRGGDLLDLIEAVRGGGKRDAIKWAKEFLGMGGVESHAVPDLKQKRRERKEEGDRDCLNRRYAADRIWRSSGPMGSVGASYLQSRGIDWGYAGSELRFHCGLAHPSGGTFPAIVARVSGPENEFVGVWRIFLKPDGSGKAPVDNPKLGLGDVAGGAVRIGGVWPIIGVAEGIENALAARQIVDRGAGRLIPVWSTLSTSGMRAVKVPPEIQEVRIFADNDAVKFDRSGAIKPSPGKQAAMVLAGRLEKEGRKVKIELPPPGLDWVQVINPGEVA